MKQWLNNQVMGIIIESCKFINKIKDMIEKINKQYNKNKKNIK